MRTKLLITGLAARLLVVVAGLLAVSCGELYEEVRSAAIFAPGVISTGHEYGVTFSPDGNIIYFTRGQDIYWSKRSGDSWEEPRRAGFSSGDWIARYTDEDSNIEYFNWDPVISPDGSNMYIMSHGLVGGKIIAGEDGDLDLWVLNREGAGFEDDAWGEPQHFGPPISLPDHNEGALGISRNGTVYFFSNGRSDTHGGSDIYYSELDQGTYRTAVNIGPVLNTEAFDGHVYADPNGRFLLYINNDRPEGYGSCDIYGSWKTNDGWGEPVNLGPNVNTELCEITPSLSPDGKTLYFGRIEDWESDVRNIYAIPLRDTGFSKTN